MHTCKHTYIHTHKQVSAFTALPAGIRARVRAQFRGLCKGDPEQPSEEDIAIFSFDQNAKPPTPRQYTPLSSPRESISSVPSMDSRTVYGLTQSISSVPSEETAEEDSKGDVEDDGEILLCSDGDADGVC